MSRIVLLAAIAGIFLTGCSHSEPPATTAQPASTAPNKGGAAPSAMAAPSGVELGDHRGGMEGGTVPGMPKK
jgi:hypothetical protein